MSRSPIEIRIDQACGIEAAPASKPSRLVLLECPQCRRTKWVPRDKSDPPSAAKVVAHCNECPGEDHGLIDYFDAAGQQILWEAAE